MKILLNVAAVARDKPWWPNVLPEPVSQMIISKPGNTKRKRKAVMAKYNDNRYTMSFIYVAFYYKSKQVSHVHYTHLIINKMKRNSLNYFTEKYK
mgnify:CR=1 FL=1